MSFETVGNIASLSDSLCCSASFSFLGSVITVFFIARDLLLSERSMLTAGLDVTFGVSFLSDISAL